MKWLILFILLMNCSLLKPSVQNKMIFEMKDFTYDVSLKVLREKLLESMVKEFSLKDSVLISVNTGTPAHKIFQDDQKICTNWYDDFSYKGQIYKAQYNGLDPLKLLSQNYRNSLIDHKGREELIVLKDNATEFIFIQNHLIFEGKKISPHHSQLHVFGITAMIYSELSRGEDCDKCVTRERSDFEKNPRSVEDVNICNVDLEKSLKFKRRLLSEELVFLYYLDPSRAKELEYHFSSV